MSAKSTPTRKTDRRVRRTRNALGDALMALMQEHPFESITVQDILDRAQIGRSTFYAHYRDKDDLFLSDAEDFLEMMSNHLLRQREASNRIVPVRELLMHFDEMRPLHDALIEADKMRDFLELGHGYFARAIDRRLAEFHRCRRDQAHNGCIEALKDALCIGKLSQMIMSDCQPDHHQE